MPAISIVIPTRNRIDLLSNCIQSILNSQFQDLEVVVVDNASTNKIINELCSDITQNEKVTIIRSETNLGAGGGRNLGAHHASGEFLMFIDDDNEIDENMLSRLHEIFSLDSTNRKFAMLGPVMLYLQKPDRIWMKYVKINLYTSQAISRFNKTKFDPENRIAETGVLPNCMMVRKTDFHSVGGFDETFLVMYEEADFAERIRKISGKKTGVLLDAVTYHDVPFYDHGLVTTCSSPERAYLTARNRTYFMRKNCNKIQLVVYAFLFFPTFTAIYSAFLIKERRFHSALQYLKGSVGGWLI